MKRIQTIMICLLAIGTVPSMIAQETKTDYKTGLEVIKAFEEEQAFDTQKSMMRIKTTNKSGKEKVRSLVQSTKAIGGGRYHTLLRFVAPANERGNSVLIHEQVDRDDDQWIYLIDLKKVRRIASSAIADNFMGTDVTYEDLGNQLSESIEDYEYELLEEESIDDFPCYKIAAIPIASDVKKHSDYSKRILWIRKDVFEIVKTTFYDKKGALFKQYKGMDIRAVEGHENTYRVYRMQVDNYAKKHSTEITIEKYDINTTIGDAVFSKRALTQIN